MGYCTIYSLSWDCSKENVRRLCEHKVTKGAKFCPECGVSTSPVDVETLISKWIKQEKLQNNDFCYGISEFGKSNDSCKWYQHDDDMKKLSEKFPNVIFTLEGTGEEPGDQWKKYYFDGKVQEAKAIITFDEFDKNKLVKM